MRLFGDARIRSTVSFTLRYTAALLAGTLILGIIIALLLNNVMRGKDFFRTMYFLPAVLSSLTVALIWNQLFTNALPQIGQALGSPLLSKNLLSNVRMAFWVVIFTALWQGLSTNVLMFLSALQNIPKDILESAALDGANGRQMFFRIKLPFLIPILNIVVILTIKGGLMAFDNIFALTGGGPARTTESIGMLIYTYAFSDFKSSYSSALAIAVFAVVAVITVLQLKSSNRLEVRA